MSTTLDRAELQAWLRLLLTPKLGPALTRCYDAKTHLAVIERGVRAGPQGNTPFVARVKDWRPVGDMKMPFVTEMQVGPLSFLGTVTSTELDGAIDASAFAVPEPAAPSGAGGATGKAKAKDKEKKGSVKDPKPKTDGGPKVPAKAGDAAPTK